MYVYMMGQGTGDGHDVKANTKALLSKGKSPPYAPMPISPPTPTPQTPLPTFAYSTSLYFYFMKIITVFPLIITLTSHYTFIHDIYMCVYALLDIEK